MYTPEHFKLDDIDIISEIIGKYPFASIISTFGGELEATHIPLILSEDRTYLLGHMASGNPLLQDGTAVLCIFPGPHAYISPTWYETDQAVPTWNYISVHVKGKMRILPSIETERVLEETVVRFEKESSGYLYSNPKPEIRKALLGKIQGFKIENLSIQAKIKLSQNHSLERRKRVIEKLEESLSTEEQELAAWMRRINSIPKD